MSLSVKATTTCDRCGTRTCEVTITVEDTYDLLHDGQEIHHHRIRVDEAPLGWMFGHLRDTGPVEGRGGPNTATCPACHKRLREEWEKWCASSAARGG